MKVEKYSWLSPNLGLNMPVAVYGHWGIPILFFPTASADYEELERFGMIEALAPSIEAGKVKVVSINAINDLSWFNEDIHPGARVWRQELYDRYIRQELVPFIHGNCGGPIAIATAGASMGAYHALNSFARHPDVFRWTVCMSGFYDPTSYLDGYWNELCYFHIPPCYLSQAQGSPQKWLLDTASLNIVCGQGPWERTEWSHHLHQSLNRGSVSHNFDLWGHDVSHDWPWWKKQMNLYISRLF